ncbi:MAG: hypothetical protein ACK5AZ_23465, partial [Bryobacteraceae bacterium]
FYTPFNGKPSQLNGRGFLWSHRTGSIDPIIAGTGGAMVRDVATLHRFISLVLPQLQSRYVIGFRDTRGAYR